MATYDVSVSRVIEAPPEVVYQIISDMEEHRKILPKEFESLIVEKGGKGAGTVALVQMKVMGVRTCLRLTVLEPEPGRVMKEVDKAAGVETTWTLTPRDGGRKCDLLLHTRFPGKPGLAGLIERLINPPVTRSLYRRELAILNAYATGRC